METCIFCQIGAKEVPAHIVWEDDNHLAFLSIYPNTQGVTVVMTKKHYPSYVFDLPDQILLKLMLATKKVAKMLDEKLEDVSRTALVFEGFGVNHIHAKLYPLHGTNNQKEWQKISSNVDKYFEKYEGYVSSHDYKREDDTKLSQLAIKIKK